MSRRSTCVSVSTSNVFPAHCTIHMCLIHARVWRRADSERCTLNIGGAPQEVPQMMLAESKVAWAIEGSNLNRTVLSLLKMQIVVAEVKFVYDERLTLWKKDIKTELQFYEYTKYCQILLSLVTIILCVRKVFNKIKINGIEFCLQMSIFILYFNSLFIEILCRLLKARCMLHV